MFQEVKLVKTNVIKITLKQLPETRFVYTKLPLKTLEEKQMTSGGILSSNYMLHGC